MRLIPTTAHGILDYATGIQLMLAPWSMGFASAGAETIVPIVLGQIIILYSLFTQYEMALFRNIPMKFHLLLDFTAGLFLLSSPWLFGFKDIVYIPHVLIGSISLLVTLLSVSHESVELGHAHNNVKVAVKDTDLSHG
jgi:hypothetical protein